MTGPTSVMNRRHHQHDNNMSHHDYLGGHGIVKSKTSIAITGSSNRNHHGDIKTSGDIHNSNKRFVERSAKTSSSNLCVVTKSGGTSNGGSGPSGNAAGGTNSHVTTGSRLKNNRQRQRPSDTKSTSRSKTTKDDITNESKNSPVPSILPPISSLQISNSKTGGDRSPRLLESSASNIHPPTLSLAPTRLAIRHNTSPEIPDTINSAHATHDHSIDATGISNKNTSGTPSQGAKRSSISRNDSSNCIRLPNNTANNNNTNKNNNHCSNNNAASPPPRSPRLVSETSRLSPINSMDKPKVKFEKKVMKSMIDNTVPTSPRAYRLGSSDAVLQQHPTNNNNNNNKTSQIKPDGQPSPNNRRQSVKSLPKLTPADEQFSIRRKIEQFRKWHEEQHADNLKRLPTEDSDEVFKNAGATTNSRPSIPGLDPLVPTCTADVMDFAKLLEDKIIQNNLKENSDAEEKLEDQAKDDCKENGNNTNNKKTPNAGGTKGKRGLNHKLSRNRPVSGATWKTWRGINESYAYDDVKKYIHDNDLMDPEREEWIKSWIHDVGKAMSEMGDITIEV